MSYRYAVYFVPDDESRLARFGFSVLQRSACGEEYPAFEKDYPDRNLLITSARVYGFHATLKAPFRLADSLTRDDACVACEQIAGLHRVIELHGLDVIEYKGFAALAFPEVLPGSKLEGDQGEQQLAHQSVMALASDCVSRLEHCRAPLNAAELERRQPALLSTAQKENLMRFGYPHVHQEYNFHMTLSGRLSARDQPFLNWARDQYNDTVSEYPLLNRLALCEQREPGGLFRRIEQWPLLV